MPTSEKNKIPLLQMAVKQPNKVRNMSPNNQYYSLPQIRESLSLQQLRMSLFFSRWRDLSKTIRISESWIILCNKFVSLLFKHMLQGPNTFLFLSSHILASTEIHRSWVQSTVDFNIAAQTKHGRARDICNKEVFT